MRDGSCRGCFEPYERVWAELGYNCVYRLEINVLYHSNAHDSVIQGTSSRTNASLVLHKIQSRFGDDKGNNEYNRGKFRVRHQCSTTWNEWYAEDVGCTEEKEAYNTWGKCETASVRDVYIITKEERHLSVSLWCLAQKHLARQHSGGMIEDPLVEQAPQTFATIVPYAVPWRPYRDCQLFFLIIEFSNMVMHGIWSSPPHSSVLD